MAHIERRVRSGKVNYRARYRDPAGRERSKSFSRKVDAERWLAEIEHAKTRGAWTDPALGMVQFSDWLAAWWATTTNWRHAASGHQPVPSCGMPALREGPDVR
jgi:hypothetical protein